MQNVPEGAGEFSQGWSEAKPLDRTPNHNTHTRPGRGGGIFCRTFRRPIRGGWEGNRAIVIQGFARLRRASPLATLLCPFGANWIMTP